jgi:hypothetical protein
VLIEVKQASLRSEGQNAGEFQYLKENGYILIIQLAASCSQLIANSVADQSGN